MFYTENVIYKNEYFPYGVEFEDVVKRAFVKKIDRCQRFGKEIEYVELICNKYEINNWLMGEKINIGVFCEICDWLGLSMEIKGLKKIVNEVLV